MHKGLGEGWMQAPSKAKVSVHIADTRTTGEAMTNYALAEEGLRSLVLQ